jgi:2-polyprenyl-3-methyl-5-hydroxy-6-metoxy-1,4-benzoquinol methylase
MTYKNEHLINQYKILHKSKSGYGNGYNVNTLNLKHLNKFLQAYSSKIILDYGCGKGDLTKYLNRSYTCYGYDPAIDKFNNEHKDKDFDTIVCLDVLEHIPEDEVSAYAKTLLPDGRNCHETVKSKEWWQNEFENIFTDQNVVVTEQKKLNQIRVLIHEN